MFTLPSNFKWRNRSTKQTYVPGEETDNRILNKDTTNLREEIHPEILGSLSSHNATATAAKMSLKGDVTQDDSQRRYLAQCWSNVATIRNTVATVLQRSKNRRC